MCHEYISQSDFEWGSSVEKDQCKVQYFICKRLFSLQSLQTFLNWKRSRFFRNEALCHLCLYLFSRHLLQGHEFHRYLQNHERQMQWVCEVEHFYKIPCLWLHAYEQKIFEILITTAFLLEAVISIETSLALKVRFDKTFTSFITDWILHNSQAIIAKTDGLFVLIHSWKASAEQVDCWDITSERCVHLHAMFVRNAKKYL